jgi:gamma-tubulin complex component 3
MLSILVALTNTSKVPCFANGVAVGLEQELSQLQDVPLPAPHASAKPQSTSPSPSPYAQPSSDRTNPYLQQRQQPQPSSSPSAAPVSLLSSQPNSHQILRAAIYALQGISSPLVTIGSGAAATAAGAETTNTETPAVTLSDDLGTADRYLLNECSTVGVMYRRLCAATGEADSDTTASKTSATSTTSTAATTTATTSDSTHNVIRSSFLTSLRKSLSSYLSLLASLTASLDSTLTKRSLLLYIAQPKSTLHLLTTLLNTTETSRYQQGGNIIAMLSLALKHGSQSHQTIVQGIVNSTERVVWKWIDLWLRTGVLINRTSDFFVAENTTVNNDNFYFSRYTLNKFMLLPSISVSLGEEIVKVGRGINFLRMLCDYDIKEGKGFYVEANASASSARTSTSSTSSTTTSTYTSSDIVSFTTAVTSTSSTINLVILDRMINHFNLLQHLKALKKFLLLGQGDFVAALLDAVGPELSKPAGSVFRHNLIGVLDTALRGTNAQYMDKDILQRVGIKLYEPSPGDSGWDIFSLDYTVTSPLTTVIHARAGSRYRRVFHLLWRLKRIEWGLNNTWRRAVSVNHALSKSTRVKRFRNKANGNNNKEENSSIVRALRNVALVRQEMLHVTSNFQNYLMFEVLEGSWVSLLDKINASKSLDDVVFAHDEYLSNIMQLALLGDDSESRGLASMLSVVFDIADRFCNVQDRLFVDCLSTISVDDDAANDGEFMRGKIEGFGQESLERVGETSAEFDAALKSLLSGLNNKLSSHNTTTQGHDALRFLTFRLDFNEYYEGKWKAP